MNVVDYPYIFPLKKKNRKTTSFLSHSSISGYHRKACLKLKTELLLIHVTEKLKERRTTSETLNRGGSRGGAGGRVGFLPTLFLDQTQAQRHEKNLFETARPLSQGLDNRPAHTPTTI